MTPVMLTKPYSSKSACLSFFPFQSSLSLSTSRPLTLARIAHSPLKLALGQVTQHLPPCNIRRPPKRREIKRAAQPIGKPKEHHRRNPAASILKRKAALGHLVLLGDAADQVVDAALGVDLGLILAGHVGGLGA